MPLGDRVLFKPAVSDNEIAGGLWISDGTEAGTFQLTSIQLGDDIVVAGNRAFFTGGTPETGSELGITDGTVAGTRLIDARPGPEGLAPQTSWKAAIGNKLVFTPGDHDDRGLILEPWISDGTVEGTHLLKDIAPGLFGSGPRQHTAVGGVVFFTADDQAHGEELWVTDGTSEGTRLVKDINRGPGSAFPGWLRNIRGILYMRADDGVHGFEPWKVTP